jgi:hypothetical protein
MRQAYEKAVDNIASYLKIRDAGIIIPIKNFLPKDTFDKVNEIRSVIEQYETYLSFRRSEHWQPYIDFCKDFLSKYLNNTILRVPVKDFDGRMPQVKQLDLLEVAIYMLFDNEVLLKNTGVGYVAELHVNKKPITAFGFDPRLALANAMLNLLLLESIYVNFEKRAPMTHNMPAIKPGMENLLALLGTKS